MLLALTRIEPGDAVHQPLRIGGRRHQVKRLFHPRPFVSGNHHDILATLTRDQHRGTIGHGLVHDLLQVLARFGISDGLHASNMDNNLSNVNQPATTTPMQILPYTDTLAPHFAHINAAWIEDMFVLEDHDRHVLAHPREAIVDKGGVILFAATPDDAIIGTGALMPTAPGAYELTKMGVLATARGTGAGAALLAALIDRARDLPGIDTLYLLTSRKCGAAIHLYERAGFVHDAEIMARFGHAYARCDVAMRYPV